MALISDIAGSLDLGGGSLLLQVNQGEREPISILFVDEQRNPVSIRDWTFSVSTEFAYISLNTQDGRTVVSNFALSTSRQTTGTPTVSKSPLVPNQLDLLLPENLYTGTVPFNETRRVPSVVVYLRVQQGSEPTSPVDIMRWIVAMRRTSGQPISPDSPLTPQTPSGVPTGGLDQEQVVALIAAPAREGSTERWALSKVPTLASLGGLDQAAVDGRIMALRPNIFTASDETKLDGIEENATADQTATEIKDSLETLSGNNRLDASAVKNIPTGGGGLNQAGVDARIQALRPNPFTDADETKLDGIENNATADQSATEIRDAIQGLSGANRLSYGNLKDTPTIPTPRTNAEIDARVVAGTLAEARAGNTGRWGKAKLPLDAIYTATQRFTTALLAKLNGIENNAKDDQSPTEIRDALAGLSGNARLAASAIRDLPTGGGSTVRSFIVNVRPSTAVSQTTTAANTYRPYQMLMTAPAITAAQAGNVEIKVHIHADVTTSTSGGGERVVTKARLRRTRGSTTTTTQDEFHFYGPRNVSQLDSDDADFYFAYAVDAQEGDVFSVEVQTASQVGSRTTEFNTTQNLLQITPIG